MEKYKMSRLSRASQFLPFDALKGLQEALRIKEYENEKVLKGELTTEKAKEITQEFLKIKKRDRVKITFYDKKDNHYHTMVGKIFLYLVEGFVDLYCENNKKERIFLDDIFDIKKLES